MSLLRRRMLMAKKPSGGGATYDDYFGEIPPESTSFGFPLYITVPFDRIEDGYRHYYREVDNLSMQLFEWANENKVLVDDFLIKCYEAYPQDLYINGRKVEYMYAELDLGAEEISFWSFITSDIYEAGIYSDNTIYIKTYLI